MTLLRQDFSTIFFRDRKSWIVLHLGCWKAVDWTFHHSYWGCPVNLKRSRYTGKNIQQSKQHACLQSDYSSKHCCFALYSNQVSLLLHAERGAKWWLYKCNYFSTVLKKEEQEKKKKKKKWAAESQCWRCIITYYHSAVLLLQLMSKKK